MKIGPKYPGEAKILIFDFSNQMASATLTSATVSVEMLRGTDAASAATRSGSPSVLGTKAFQLIVNGVVGAAYKYRCLAAASDGQVHEVSAEMEVSLP